MEINPRYARNIHALSANDVLLLHTKKVCVVGCGGLGGYIIETLARLGVLHITVVDYDVFELSNLNRQLFSEEGLIGSYKADAAVERIKKVNSDVKITGIKEKLTQKNAHEIIHRHDIVMDALDNMETRLLLADVCAELQIPMIHGAVAGWYGQVAAIFPGDDILQKLFKNTNINRGIEKELGNLPFTVAAVASIQCAECVKVLTGKNIKQNTLTTVDLLNNTIKDIQI